MSCFSCLASNSVKRLNWLEKKPLIIIMFQSWNSQAGLWKLHFSQLILLRGYWYQSTVAASDFCLCLTLTMLDEQTLVPFEIPFYQIKTYSRYSVICMPIFIMYPPNNQLTNQPTDWPSSNKGNLFLFSLFIHSRK